MPITNDEVLELARDALAKMLHDNGPNYTFPFDAIWQNTPPEIDIPSGSRPHQSKPLIKEGYIEKTGEMTRAVSEKRAGSATPAYRFGPRLVPPQAAPPTAAAATAADRPSDLLKLMQQAMDSKGYLISSAELANFFLAMTVSPLVILSGISGTGKSLLPRLFAESTGSMFAPIPVQPQWSDNSDLFGYVPTLSPDTFVRGRLIKSLLQAKENENTLVVALLDEMNLAPVEHYFSDFLSVAETRARRAGAVVTDELPIELPTAPATGEDPDADLRKICLPPNLRIVGTANMDETTHSFSPKVLDRAFTIELDDPELTAFASGEFESFASTETLAILASSIVNKSNAISVLEARAHNQALFDQIAVMLQEIKEILAPAGIKFGYRTRDAILLYLHFWRQMDLADILTSNAALDYCLLQKILPKISGSGQVLEDALENLSKWLKKDRSATDSDDSDDTGFGLSASVGEFTGPFTRCVLKVNRMKALLVADGATHYWGT